MSHPTDDREPARSAPAARRRPYSPQTFMAVIALAVFLGEAAVMALLNSLATEFSAPVEALIDATLLTVALAPILYYFSYRPMSRHLQRAEDAEEEAAAQSRFLRQTLESLPYPFYVIRVDDYTVTLANEAGKKGQIHATGRPCYEVSHRRTQPCDEEGRRCPIDVVVTTGKPMILEHVHDTDAGPIQVEVSSFPIRNVDGNVTHVIEYCVDISERKRAEEELLGAKTQAEKATRMKDKFVSLVAHDLRSPFTSIIGILSLLDRDMGESLGERRRSLLTRAISSGENLVRMIDELLNISRLQLGEVTPRPCFVEAARIGAQAIDQYRFAADEKGVWLVNDVPPDLWLYADPILYGEVVTNLISNAVKFCGRGDTISVAPLTEGTGLSVSDTGPGVSEGLVEHLFRHDIKTTLPGSAGEKGTGLGLPFCADIMRVHGGRLEYRRLGENGATFTTHLPFVVPTVMIVTPDAGKRARLIDAVVKAVPQAAVLSAGDHHEAWRLLEERPAHALIDDLAGGADYTPFIDRLTDLPNHHDTRIVALYEERDPLSRERALAVASENLVPWALGADVAALRVREALLSSNTR